MALDARTRSEIYGKLSPLLGEEHANALMSEFPALEADELVTKQFLRAEMAELRTEMAELRTELRTDLRGEIGSVRTEMAERFHRQTTWLVATVAGSAAVIVAAIPLLS